MCKPTVDAQWPAASHEASLEFSKKVAVIIVTSYFPDSSPEKLSGRQTFHILIQRRGGIGSSIEEARGYNTGAMCHVLTSEDESRG